MILYHLHTIYCVKNAFQSFFDTKSEAKMNIQGLQKLTLLDFPGKVACTVFTGGCNFRCPFCHNASLVIGCDTEAAYSEEKILAFLEKRVGVLDGVCITGGEPLLQRDIIPFLEKIKALGYSIKLDTNGSFPKRLKELAALGLIDYVAMDIKNSPHSYAKTVGLNAFDISAINESVDFLLSGAVDYEFRTTVVKELHTEEDFLHIADWLEGAKRYFLQGFIDSGDIIGNNLHAYSSQEMHGFKDMVKNRIPSVQVRGID